MGDFPIGFGRYQLVEQLAVGGMAELFVATSPGEHGFQKRVVIKRLLPHLVADATYKAMFIDEAKLTARLVHPKIAQTFELGKVGDALYIAMEHVEGIDVLALLREFASRRRRIDQPLAAWVAHEVLDALDYAHNLTGEDGTPLGIVHRDISPSNILLSLRGDIKLVDFGIARAVDPDRAHKSKSGTLKGKYGYMSPEQVVEQGLDARSDLFSVGVVLAELLTGRRLFAAPNELDVLLMVRDAKLTRFDKYGGDIEPGLAAIVRKALRKTVDERWQTAAAFRDAISEWLYEHRHRVTPRTVADVVLDLREAVRERRQRQLSGAAEAAPAAGAAPAQAPAARVPSAQMPAMESGPLESGSAASAAAASAAASPSAEVPAAEVPSSEGSASRAAWSEPASRSDAEGIVMMIEDPGDSMPNISVSYDPPPVVEEKRRPAAASEIAVTPPRPVIPVIPVKPKLPVTPAVPSAPPAASAPSLPAVPSLPRIPSTRADTVPGRPTRAEAPERGAGAPAAPVIPAVPAPAVPAAPAASGSPAAPAGRPGWPAMPAAVPEAIRAERASASTPARVVHEIIEVPIADTISAAVEAITLPEMLEPSAPRAERDPDASGAPTAAGSMDAVDVRSIEAAAEDSLIRAFEDLVEPPPMRIVRQPTEAEVLRARPAPPALSDIADPPDDTGDFSTTPPLRVLFRLMTARATGLLVVAVGGVKKDIYVRDGMPEYVSSNIASELFGNYLVTRGVLSDGELAMALAMMPHYGGKLGDTLVGLGLMKPLEVFRHLTRQVRTKIIDVCSWNKGSFSWYAGRENPREAFPLDFNAFEILGAGAMAMPDEHVESWIEKHGHVRLRAVRSRRVGPERFEVPGLVELFDLLDGRRSVSDVVERSPEPADRLRTGRMLCLLEACDLARPVSGAA